MILKEILNGVKIVKKSDNFDEQMDITGIYTDTSKIKVNGMFICIDGTIVNSHNLVNKLSYNEIKVLIVDYFVDSPIPQVVVENTRDVLGQIARNFNSNPQDKLKIIGVTGTNGKTSVTYLIRDILESANKKVGVIGTLGAKIYDLDYNIHLTTPDPIVLYDLFAKMVKSGIEYVVMEVSAHALDLKRVEGLYFQVAVFTNFTQDHLDYFGNMENYKQAKLKLFTENFSKYAVVNIDDEVGGRIYEERPNVLTYGLNNPADSFAIDVVESGDGLSFILNILDSIYDEKVRLIGKFNVYNILAATTVCAVLGIKSNDIAKGLKNLKVVSGRMECVATKKDAKIFIDYAHTPDGLENILKSARSITQDRLVCLFGCGGNRDKSKRAIMGEIAGQFADFVVLTSDNPRYEEPMSIINDIEEGLRRKSKKYVVIQNREKAIEYAIGYITSKDSLIVCGKGAENYQEILGIKHPFNDKKIIQSILV